MNCLAYALRFWVKNPEYKIWYNSDHCINSRCTIVSDEWLPAESFGYAYFLKSSEGLLDRYEMILLKMYFTKKVGPGRNQDRNQN